MKRKDYEALMGAIAKAFDHFNAEHREEMEILRDQIVNLRATVAELQGELNPQRRAFLTSKSALENYMDRVEFGDLAQ